MAGSVVLGQMKRSFKVNRMSTEKIEKFFRILNETKEPAYDVETTGLDWKSCHVVGYSVSDNKDSVYIPVRHGGGGNIVHPDQFELSLNRCLAQHQGKIVGHNIKFDMHFSENHGINLGNKVVDTMVMEALIDENQRSYSLENVCKRRGITPKLGTDLYRHIAQQTGCTADRRSMGHYWRLRGDDHLAVEYAERDTLCTYQLFQAQKKSLYAQQLDVVQDLECQLTYVLQKMERRGILIDQDELTKVKDNIDIMASEALANLITEDPETGVLTEVNVRSSKDLKQYFEQCEMDDWPMTAPTQRFPDGQPSFTQDYLAASAEGLAILNARKLQHLQNSFLTPIDNFIFRSRIHTTFNQTMGETHGTRSGRLSSSWPNMQQVPKRDKELGQIFRRIFVPRKDYVFVEFDYSQCEPRLFTHYSGEPVLIDGYNKSPAIDMHAIAAEYMGVSRDTAKNLNLAIMYAMGPKKLSAKLGVSYDAAMDILNKWQRTFPRVSSYSRTMPGFTQLAAKAADDRGYVRTILGRRSHFDDRRFTYRAANRIVQGGSADILKWKLCEINRYIEHGWEEEARMILTIHDSILFEIQKECLHLIDEIRRIMEDVQGIPFNLKVPFVAEYKTGSNWSEATYGTA